MLASTPSSELRVAFRLFTFCKEPNAHPKPLSPLPLADARHAAIDIGRGKVHPLHAYDRTMQHAVAKLGKVRDVHVGHGDPCAKAAA